MMMIMMTIRVLFVEIRNAHRENNGNIRMHERKVREIAKCKMRKKKNKVEEKTEDEEL